MKIITWNVNGLRAVERKKELQKLITKQTPDILLIQEIKGKSEQFSEYLTANKKYQQFYSSAEKPGYAGTGIWIKKIFINKLNDIRFYTTIPEAPNMDEGRIAHISFTLRQKKYDILSIYFPNGGKSEQAWLDKLIFFDKVLDFINKLRKNGSEVIIGGDMNVAHTELDIKRAKENDGNIGFHPQERAWVDKVISDNWVDVWRVKNPKIVEVYSWWNVYTRARERNVGWRIDYFFIDKKLLKQVREIKYLKNQMGSDHCPLLMNIAI
ncbi:MAG TPA: exodeoxyribonuclease III [Candidatus Moranbacteria bacterium]|nr:exodeoxyribonuclease III [Candidatus Moranbacteria bacterium]